MFGTQGKTTIVIRYPQIRGSILKAYELQQMIGARFQATVELEAHTDNRLALILDEKTLYSQTVDEDVRIDHRKCFEALRRQQIVEHEPPVASPDPDRNEDDDPDHRQWLNTVCSGE